MIVLTGVTGNVGGAAARLLAAAGHPVRLLVRRPGAAPRLPGPDVVDTDVVGTDVAGTDVAGTDVAGTDVAGPEVVGADYTDPESLARALRPGDRVFMVSLHLSPAERIAAHRNVIDAAARAGVDQLVYLSFLNASPESAFLHSRSHAATEELIRAAGVPATILRTGLYSSSLPHFYRAGLMRAPGGSGGVSWVDRRDCGAMVAAVLTGPGHEGATYDVTGPEAPNLATTTALVRDRLGVDYRYQDADDPAALPAAGLPAWEVPSRRSCFLAIAAGELATVSGELRRIAGLEPSTVDRYLTENPADFPPAPGPGDRPVAVPTKGSGEWDG
jgi:NAD(P)H dehydrogenase (quinone)